MIINDEVPKQMKLITGKIPRCFLAFLSGKDGPKWVIGETNRKSGDLRGAKFQGEKTNRPIAPDDRLENLLGGGGWIVRNRKDVHLEAYNRQNFRFRKVDQDSRHTVIAMDEKDRLYILVFETGANLERVSGMLRKRPELPGIPDAFFLDGGSSSTIVLGNGKYLVPPMYLIDKSRFSAILVLKTP